MGGREERKEERRVGRRAEDKQERRVVKGKEGRKNDRNGGSRQQVEGL